MDEPKQAAASVKTDTRGSVESRLILSAGKELENATVTETSLASNILLKKELAVHARSAILGNEWEPISVKPMEKPKGDLFLFFPMENRYVYSDIHTLFYEAVEGNFVVEKAYGSNFFSCIVEYTGLKKYEGKVFKTFYQARSGSIQSAPVSDLRSAASDTKKKRRHVSSSDEMEQSHVWRDRHNKKFLTTWVKLASMKDDAEAFTTKHGLLYRWQWRYEEVMPNVVEGSVLKQMCKMLDKTDGPNGEQVLSSGWSWRLEVLSSSSWCAWLTIRGGETNEVYAEREFLKGSLVGFYIGPTLMNDEVLSAAPSSDLVRALSVYGESSAVVQSNEGVWHLVSPESVTTEEASSVSLYLGMHYIRSAMNGNCVVTNNGSVQCITDVQEGEELVVLGSDRVYNVEEKVAVEADERVA